MTVVGKNGDRPPTQNEIEDRDFVYAVIRHTAVGLNTWSIASACFDMLVDTFIYSSRSPEEADQQFDASVVEVKKAFRQHWDRVKNSRLASTECAGRA